MIYSTATVPVNPTGEVPLTRAQAWAGLVRKARDARQFLPPGLCTQCDVVDYTALPSGSAAGREQASARADSATHIVREATIAGSALREIISFEPETKVSFFQASGPREGVIVNELFEDEAGALQLRFYGYLGLRGKAPGGPEEQAEQALLNSASGYRSALLSTLKRTRELVAAHAL